MPFIILIACAWIIGRIAEKAQKRQKLAQVEKARQESIAAVEAARAAERANRERIAREKQAEKAKKAERERLYKVEQAKKEISHYQPIIEDLNRRREKALIGLEYARLANYSGEKLLKAQKPVDDLDAKIYQTEKKIEKAYHTLTMCNA